MAAMPSGPMPQTADSSVSTDRKFSVLLIRWTRYPFAYTKNNILVLAMGAQEGPGSGAEPDSPGKSHQILIIGISIGIGALLLFAAYLYWEYDFGHPTTDDAYLQANTVWITPQVSGQVMQIHVQDNQPVRAGDALFDIDDRVYAAELERASSELSLVKQGIEVDSASVQAAGALVEEKRAALDVAAERYERTKQLVAKGNASKIKGIQDRDAMLEAKADLADYQDRLDVARKRLGTPDEQQARVNKAEAAVALAKLNLGWTRVAAPSDGYVTRFALRSGQYVSPDQAIFPLVESGEWWVQANFKETKLANMRVGQAAEVKVDLYGGRIFRGTVESISSASAASFSLLPPQNTTGNWVKVTQRIPVRIRMDTPPPDTPFRIGASCVVTVNTGSGK